MFSRHFLTLNPSAILLQKGSYCSFFHVTGGSVQIQIQEAGCVDQAEGNTEEGGEGRVEVRRQMVPWVGCYTKCGQMEVGDSGFDYVFLIKDNNTTITKYLLGCTVCT